MCDPIIFAAVGAAASIGGAVVNYSAEQSQANAQRQYQSYIQKQTQELASANLINQFAAMNQRQVEEQRKASQEISEIAQQAREAKATAYASSIQSGVAGLSIDSLIDSYTARESKFIQRTQEQERNILNQLQREATGMSYQYTGQVVGATPAPISGPSGLALVARVGGAAFNFFGETDNFEYFFGE